MQNKFNVYIILFIFNIKKIVNKINKLQETFVI